MRVSRTSQHLSVNCRLVLNDASTYDVATKTGGMDASIILNKNEAGRPENAGLSAYVEKLKKAKAAIDANNAALGSGPVSWADVMCLGVRVTQEAEWKRIKIGRAAIPSGILLVARMHAQRTIHTPCVHPKSSASCSMN
jgi:hypothetical protein